jgi:lipopolysaccharide transport system permease protein
LHKPLAGPTADPQALSEMTRTRCGRESLPRSSERSARQIAGGGLSENLTPNTRHLLVIEAGWAGRYYWRDMWAYRELFAILAWRDVAVRYKQTVIGVAWAIVRPFLAMVIFTVVFGRVAGLPSEGGAPYPVMVFAGMLPWFLFSTILSEASNSLVGNANLVEKVYFPRLIIPASSGVVALVDFAINLAILFGLMVWYGFWPTWRFALLPAFVALAMLASLGPAFLITALNVKYRDFRYVIPFIVQFGLYVSPVGFSSAIMPEQWRFWYSLNPMVGVIDGFRWCVLGGEARLYAPGFVLGLGVVALFLWFGIAYFRRTEHSFADLI